ncbi:oxygenase MpaB family protein [Jatrophihabitans sp.]|uniref:oxygenase MpaB family protein n=1 Tax=Jatrophihabitans sp. TaxID=1932789 RepID=UPI002CC2A940|nr:oxygenase MpaB family protein [Jatrophihabitans sp.]
MTLPVLSAVRERLGSALFEQVAGSRGPQRRERIHQATGPRWFDASRPIWQVHSDAAMFVGGLRALLLQSLHPLAMAGVAAHSGYRGDPWGRLHRTSHFLAVTTFGVEADALEMIARIRAIHDRVQGTAPDGRHYAASDPHLLRWVHLAEVDSFLTTYQRYGANPLGQAGRDGYVADSARVAAALGVLDPPTTEAQVRVELEAYRPELAGTREAREAARFMLLTPPLPLAARAPYGALAAAAVASLPRWARWPLRLPYLPLAEATVVRLAGEGLVRGIRWVLTPTPDAA